MLKHLITKNGDSQCPEFENLDVDMADLASVSDRALGTWLTCEQDGSSDGIGGYLFRLGCLQASLCGGLH